MMQRAVVTRDWRGEATDQIVVNQMPSLEASLLPLIVDKTRSVQQPADYLTRCVRLVQLH